MKNISIVTSGQPSANPRVVKEATALSAAGFNVTVIYAPLSPWADKFDAQLFNNTPRIKWIKAGYHQKTQKNLYRLVRVRRKFNQWLVKYLSFLNIPFEHAFVLFAQELKKETGRVKADLYIGHNLGALPIVVKAARKSGVPCAFDAEDFHRGESSINSLENKLVIGLENKYIPLLSYLTCASPLISEAYQKLFPLLKVQTINNVFSKNFLQPVSEKESRSLSLFWFSQTVGTNRGLEVVIAALNKLKNSNVSLHILGHCSTNFKEYLVQLSDNPKAVHFIEPVPLEEIFKLSSAFDIGLATEVPHIINRDICLTNKLFTYLLASNCILASNTRAQQRFFDENPGIGLTYACDDPLDLASKIEVLFGQPTLLNNCKERSHFLAFSSLNWEKEALKTLDLVRFVIQ